MLVLSYVKQSENRERVGERVEKKIEERKESMSNFIF